MMMMNQNRSQRQLAGDMRPLTRCVYQLRTFLPLSRDIEVDRFRQGGRVNTKDGCFGGNSVSRRWKSIKQEVPVTVPFSILRQLEKHRWKRAVPMKQGKWKLRSERQCQCQWGILGGFSFPGFSQSVVHLNVCGLACLVCSMTRTLMSTAMSESRLSSLEKKILMRWH